MLLSSGSLHNQLKDIEARADIGHWEDDLKSAWSLAWVQNGSSPVEEAALPKSVESSYIRVNNAIIRWISANTRRRH